MSFAFKHEMTVIEYELSSEVETLRFEFVSN